MPQIVAVIWLQGLVIHEHFCVWTTRCGLMNQWSLKVLLKIGEAMLKLPAVFLRAEQILHVLQIHPYSYRQCFLDSHTWQSLWKFIFDGWSFQEYFREHWRLCIMVLSPPSTTLAFAWLPRNFTHTLPFESKTKISNNNIISSGFDSHGF